MGERIELVKGTKEYMVIDITDTFGDITDLSALGPTFDIRRTIDGNWIFVNQLVVASGLQARCLIDTTQSVFDVSGIYEVYLQFTNAPEQPRLGPYEFYLSDAPLVPSVREIRDEDTTLVVQVDSNGDVHVQVGANVIYDL